MVTPQSPPHVRELDGLRGLLAMWVFVYHVVSISGTWSLLPRSIQVIADGARAVDVFIILSGFVVTGLLLNTSEGYRTFVARRFLRLYPTFVICILASLATEFAGLMPVRFEAGQLWAYLLTHSIMLFGAVPDSVPGSGSAILNPAWSISLEWQFYLIAPLFAFLFSRGRTGVIVASIVVIFAYRAVAPTLQGFPGSFLPFHIHFFWIGMISYLIYDRSGQGADMFVGWILAALGVLLLLPYAPNVGLHIWLGVFAAVLARFQPALGLLRLDPVVTLGAMSYPIYLCHEPIIWAARGLFGIDDGTFRASLLLFSICCPLVLAASFLIHRFIEVPVIAWGRTLSRPARQPPMSE